MKTMRTEALRELEDETRQARERFEQEARQFSEVWAAYEGWRAGRQGEPVGRLLDQAPELARLWSTYLASGRAAEARPLAAELARHPRPGRSHASQWQEDRAIMRNGFDALERSSCEAVRAPYEKHDRSAVARRTAWGKSRAPRRPISGGVSK